MEGAETLDRCRHTKLVLEVGRQIVHGRLVPSRNEYRCHREVVERLARLGSSFESLDVGFRRARRYWASENSSVTLMLIPREISSSMAGAPSGVPGTLIIRFGESARLKSESPCWMVVSVSLARSGETSSEQQPSVWPETSQMVLKSEAALLRS